MALSFNGKDVKKVKFNNSDVNYVIKDGKLVWANPNLYLSTTGTQYINTNINLGMNKSIKCGIYNNNMSDNRWCGGRKYILAFNTNRLPVCANSKWNDTFTSSISSGHHLVQVDISNDGYKLIVDDVIQQDVSAAQSTDDYPCFIGRSNQSVRGALYGKIYFVQLYESNTRVQYLVPVPAGLKIGDYTVPSNGMWDIVTQQFFGNSGTGEFSYGKDE